MMPLLDKPITRPIKACGNCGETYLQTEPACPTCGWLYQKDTSPHHNNKSSEFQLKAQCSQFDDQELIYSKNSGLFPSLSPQGWYLKESSQSSLQRLRIDQLEGHILQGKYQLLEVVAKGGMGIVYRARQLEENKDVAIKIAFEQFAIDQEFRKRFIKEAEIQFMLEHPGIVKVFDLLEDNWLALVMDWIEGLTLAEWMKTQTKVPQSEEIIRLFIPILNAVGYAHRHNVVHRDLSPSNILLQGEKGRETPKITDFGIAKIIDSKTQGMTGRKVIGKLAYMSPEQILCNPRIDLRADVYSLGILLFELATGGPPFSGSDQELLHFHINKSIPSLVKSNPHADLRFSNVIAKACHKKPQKRFQNCQEFADALQKVLEQEPITLESPLECPIRRRKTKRQFKPPADTQKENNLPVQVLKGSEARKLFTEESISSLRSLIESDFDQAIPALQNALSAMESTPSLSHLFESEIIDSKHLLLNDKTIPLHRESPYLEKLRAKKQQNLHQQETKALRENLFVARESKSLINTPNYLEPVRDTSTLDTPFPEYSLDQFDVAQHKTKAFLTADDLLLDIPPPSSRSPQNRTIKAIFFTVAIIFAAFASLLVMQSLPVDLTVARLQLQSDQKQVNIFINDKASGQTPIKLDLKKGQYKLRFTKKGFFDKIIHWKHQTKGLLKVHLVPQKELYLSSEPKGEQVFLNGKLVGKTPLLLKAREAVHKLQVGMGKQARKFIWDQQIEKLHLQLVTLVTLELNSNPTGADIYINKKLMGKTPRKLKFPKGKSYKIKLLKKKFVSYQFEWSSQKKEKRLLHLAPSLF